MSLIRLLALAGLTLCFLFGILRSHAAEPVDNLLSALGEIDVMQGRFEQRQISEQGEFLARSSGNFRLLRPGYFSWEITDPDSQLIIADPQYVWHHDRDLETVTRRPVGDHLDASPLQVLGGDDSILREQFQVREEGGGQFVLTSLSEASSFNELVIELKDGAVQRMEITNKLNQRVSIEFSNVDVNSELETGDFAFSPPEGVDLFYYDE